MTDDLEGIVLRLNETDDKIDNVSKELVLLQHQYRTTKDSTIRDEIKKKWDRLQKKMDTLEKKRRVVLEKKNEIEFKAKWKGWK